MAFSVVPDRASGDVFTEQMWDDYVKTNFNTGVPVVLANSTLSGAAASIDFSSISQSWAHLMLVLYLRSDAAATEVGGLIRFNADTGANYDYQYIQGFAATAQAVETFAGTSALLGSIAANLAGANLFSAIVVNIPHYAQSSNNKSLSSRWAHKYGTTTSDMAAGSCAQFWRSNSAITQVTILAGTGNLNTGSRATLYGLP